MNRRTRVLIAALAAACAPGASSRQGTPVPVTVLAGAPIDSAIPADVTVAAGKLPAVPPQVALLSGLMPLRSTGVTEFLAAHPTYDGRGVVIAILDSGIDPGTYGLITTSVGSPKLIELRDFSGEGRIALTAVAPGGDGTVAVGGQKLHGTGRIGRLANADTWYAGMFRELPLGPLPASDVNGNGTDTDEFPVIVVRASDGWVTFIDSNRDGSFEDEMPLHDYRMGRETIALGTRPLTMAANISETGAGNPPLLDLYFDTSGHGTHVAGIAAGHNLFNIAAFNGVAPGAQLIGLKIANNARGGVSVNGSMRRAMDYAARYAAQRNLPLVLNMSFGVGNEMPGRAAIDSVINAFLVAHPGVVFTISAGNDGPGISTVDFPGSADLALSVGSAFPGAFARPAQPGIPAAGDVPGWWSSRGGASGKPDVVTPGVAYSSVPPWDRGNEIKGGTSMSAPLAAGLVACLVSAMVQEGRPVNAADLVQALRVTATPFPRITILDQGAGVPRLEAAYRWLAAGHQGSSYVVRTDRGAPAAFRRDGLAGSGDTLQTFLVHHAAGLRAAEFRLRADVPWLTAPEVVTAEPGETEIPVSYRAAAFAAPGLYVGRVTARNPSDTLAGPLFTLVNTIVVPYDVAAKPLFDERRVIPAGAVQRYFVRLPVPGATLTASVVLPDSGRETAIVRLFEPNGQPFRDEDEDLPVGREDGGSAMLAVRAEDAVPGVYELDVIAPPLKPVTATVRVLSAPVALARSGSSSEVEISNAGTASVVVAASATVIGAERTYEVTGRGLPPETLTVDVPGWAARAEVDVQVPPAQWNGFTDFAITMFDSTGRQVHSAPANFPFARQRFPVPRAINGQTVRLELFPAIALPEAARGWRATVSIRFLLDAPERAGDARDVTVVPGGRMTAPLRAVGGFELPEGFGLLYQVVARSGTGATAVRRVAGSVP